MAVLQEMPQEDRLSSLDISDGELPTTKALGVTWQAQEDDFRVKLVLPEIEKVTKRQVVKQIAKLFDPLGFLAPCIVVGKILVQELWTLGVT